LPSASRKDIKIAPAIGGARPQKNFFSFLPPLIFCFQKPKENHNVKRIK